MPHKLELPEEEGEQVIFLKSQLGFAANMLENICNAADIDLDDTKLKFTAVQKDRSENELATLSIREMVEAWRGVTK